MIFWKLQEPLIWNSKQEFIIVINCVKKSSYECLGQLIFIGTFYGVFRNYQNYNYLCNMIHLRIKSSRELSSQFIRIWSSWTKISEPKWFIIYANKYSWTMLVGLNRLRGTGDSIIVLSLFLLITVILFIMPLCFSLFTPANYFWLLAYNCFKQLLNEKIIFNSWMRLQALNLIQNLCKHLYI